ncbi:hypothetical protein [Dyadobacter sp.]|uniref:hypothetical protein n=1 Tax=Dyadobacter sp. TaxID=1914288 RepID=UPI003F6F258C
MKKTLFLAVLTFCLLGTDAFGQQATKPPEKAGDAKLPFKWDLSLNMYPLVKTGRLGFLIRYSPNQKGAFRLSFDNVQFGKTKSAQYIGVIDGPRLDTIRVTTSTFGYGTQRIGYEVHFNSDQHQLYCGMDLGFFFYYERHNPGIAHTSRMYKLSANPFVGLKYRVLDRLSLSAELSGQLVYQLSSVIAHNRETMSDNKLWALSIESSHFFNISYHF